MRLVGGSRVASHVGLKWQGRETGLGLAVIGGEVCALRMELPAATKEGAPTFYQPARMWGVSVEAS